MSKRQPLDNYPTMQELTYALLDRLPELARSPYPTICEPCVGDGAIARAIWKRRTDAIITTNDINPDVQAFLHSDAADPAASIWQAEWAGQPPEWVITNPPFNAAHAILPLAFEHATVGVAFLLRLTYMEPTMKRQPRGEWLQAHADQMVRMIPFGNPRPWFPPYARNQTDSTTSAWFVWLKNWSWKAAGIPAPFQFVADWLQDETEDGAE